MRTQPSAVDSTAIFTCLFLAGFGLSCSRPSLEVYPKPTDVVVDTVEGKIVVEGRSVLQLPDRFVWGSTVLKGDDGRYHMLFNTWPSGPDVPKFSDSWVLHSEIGYAISDAPDHGFEFQKVAIRGRMYDSDSTAWDARMVTNPHLKRFGDTYYLYYVGSRDPGRQPEGSSGEHVSLRNRVQQVQRIGLITFKSFEDLLDGRFERPDTPLLSPRTRVKQDNIVEPSPENTRPKPDNIVVVNPSVVYNPSDRNYLLYFKGNLYDPSWRGVHGVATAPSPAGPFQALDDFVFDIKMPDGRIASAEDPFVWYHHGHQTFYAVVKDFTGRLTGSEPGITLLRSNDGMEWSRARPPLFMRKEILGKGGRRIPVDRLERPQLLVSDDGTPEVLYAASSVDPCNEKQDGGTFNVQIALEAK